MSLTELIGRLLGYENVSSIEAVKPSFGSQWAQNGPAWVFFGCTALAAVAGVFYLRYQNRGTRSARLLLAAGRAVLLCLLLLILADPILEVTFTTHPKPSLWVLFDGTDSMAIADRYPTSRQQSLAESVGLNEYRKKQDAGEIASNNPGSETIGGTNVPPRDLRRVDYVRALLQKREKNPLRQLAERFRLRSYLFGRPDGVQRLGHGEDDQAIDLQQVSEQLTTDGEVTALGNALRDLARRGVTGNLAGLLVVSDFQQNAGVSARSAAEELDVPIFSLGVGPRSAIDLAVDLQAPVKMKKAEQSTLTVTLRQQELQGRSVPVRVTARPAGTSGGEGGDTGEVIRIGRRAIRLEDRSVSAEFPFVPEEAGRYIFTAEVEPLQGEIVSQNNRAEREVRIIDDFLRLLFVEYEPTWEWRFIKEVFHRDKLVGLRGFRTYLRSADPVVRENNELFVPSLTMPRKKFFKHDVIFLGDMPGETISTRFAEMTQEFVSQFGGGLVVMAGPRFGPGELAGTPLGEMLPVIVDPSARLRDEQPFPLQLSPMAEHYGFMQLGQNQQDHRQAWENLRRLPWYQPVKRLEPSASTILAQHPTATCVDGETPQPLIAIRKYGRGEVVYLAFNEMWRLRRKYGDRYYRQFWGQMIHRLGLSHALGNQKRFVVRTDRQQYQPDEDVLLTVEAYDENYEPLTEDDLPEETLQGRLQQPAGPSQETETFHIAQRRPGLFETRLPVSASGEYTVQVSDPVSEEAATAHFEVESLSAERRSAVRNAGLQHSLATLTGGRAYEFDTIAHLAEEFQPPRLKQTTVKIFPLWNTWLCFTVVVLLMLGEWFVRKLVNLP